LSNDKDNEPVKVLATDATGETNMTALVEPIPLKADVHDGKARYAYNIKAANRNASPIFWAHYYVLGPNTPKVTVETAKAGIRVQPRQPLDRGATVPDVYKVLISEIAGALLAFMAFVAFNAFIRARGARRVGQSLS
jgi:hypothetical protein